MRQFLSILALSVISLASYGQSVTGAYTISQHDLRGTARYMSMAGAFGALGGDMTAITQNPGGIGIYRSNDIGLTLGLDALNTKAESGGLSSTDNMTRFNLNNIGAVFTLKLYNNTLPNLNFGFVYNKGASFNRSFNGTIPNLRTSMSNYIAGLSNSYGLNEADVSFGPNYDPYNPPAGTRAVPWLAVMGYYGFLTTPEGNQENPNWYGQFGEGTSGTGGFKVNEKGSIDEYNIIIGGNINNVVYLGMNFDITSVDYRIQSAWGEYLQNAYVYNPNNDRVGRYESNWTLYDNYRLNGTGFKFNMGLIVKPIQELRFGFAFHTPTFYNLNETYYDAHINFNYPFKTEYSSEWANDGYSATNSINFNTPWKLIASVAGVIGSNFIVSAEYEWNGYKSMKYSEANVYDYYDPWYDWDNPWNDWGWGGWYSPKKKANNHASSSSRDYYTNPNDYANAMIKEVYQNSNTFRIGAEYRVIPSFSIRAGYSYTSSPVSTKVKNYQVEVPGTGIMTNYSLDNSTSYITCGVGYKYKGFYADLAYVYKHLTSEYYPFTPDIFNPQTAAKADLTINNSSLALTLGYKF